MADELKLRVGEERGVHLPAGGGAWRYSVEGMTSAIDIRKLWAADPWRDEDDEDRADQEPPPPPDVVFMVRGKAPGAARIAFEPERTGAAERRDVAVAVSL